MIASKTQITNSNSTTSISKVANESKEKDNYPDQQNPFNDLDDFSDEDDPKNEKIITSMPVPLVETNFKKENNPSPQHITKTLAPKAANNENEHDDKVKEAIVPVRVNNEVENEYENFNKLTIPPPLPILPPPSLDIYDNIINRDLNKDASTNYDNFSISNNNKVSDFFLTENDIFCADPITKSDKKTNAIGFLDKKLSLSEEQQQSSDCIYQNLKDNRENDFKFKIKIFKWV